MFTASTGASVGAADYLLFMQKIEGFNTVDLAFGTASAATVTLSFWVRSSITGTYSAFLQNSAASRAYVATYTISAANTWEQKSITIAGDTTGTWIGATSEIGLRVGFDLGSGSNYSTTAGAWTAGNYTRTSGTVNWGATTGATFYITGVQLEKGSTATSFDFRPYGTELSLCQRYCTVFTNLNTNDGIPGLGMAYSTTRVISQMSLPVTPRTNAPSVSYTGVWSVSDGVTATAATNVTSGGTGINCASLDFTVASGLTQYRPYYAYSGSTGSKIIVSMEL
jgi:hypothetical protein